VLARDIWLRCTSSHGQGVEAEGLLQAQRSQDVTNWAASEAGPVDLSKQRDGDQAFMWDGDLACDSRPTSIAASHMLAPSPSHAMLLSASPKIVPLPAQRSVDPRLATSAAASSERLRQPGPGSYEAAASAFGVERAYEVVQRPESPHALGLPKGVSGRQVIKQLVKRCAFLSRLVSALAAVYTTTRNLQRRLHAASLNARRIGASEWCIYMQVCKR
jgi:hypothetical protein